MTLQEFIDKHHAKLVSMTREKVAKRSPHRRPEGLETRHGVHLFLDQLREALEAEARRDPSQRAEPDPPTNPNIAKSAALHGHDLLVLGFSVDEVVHDYGDVCQAVTELAVELDEDVSVAEFHTLNRCLDNAIAAAVTAWTDAPQAPTTEGQEVSRDERLRRLLGGAIAAFELLHCGKVAAGGSTGMALGNNLAAMHEALPSSHCSSGSPSPSPQVARGAPLKATAAMRRRPRVSRSRAPRASRVIFVLGYPRTRRIPPRVPPDLASPALADQRGPQRGAAVPRGPGNRRRGDGIAVIRMPTRRASCRREHRIDPRRRLDHWAMNFRCS